MKRTTTAELTHLLKKQLLSSVAGSRLDPVRTLAGQYGVSPTTITKAMQELKREGLVAVSFNGKSLIVVGQPARIAGDDLSRQPGNTSVETFAAGLEQRLLEGCWRLGRSLPKVAYFTLSDRVSSRTVCYGLRLLEGKGLIHKRGKSWFAGPGTAETGRVSGPGRVAVILMPDDNVYEAYCAFALLSSFIDNVTDELARNGCSHAVVIRHPCSSMVPSGRAAIERYLATLGDRYAGTLIFAHLQGIPDIAVWVKFFKRYDEPVVWFDYDDQGCDIGRETVCYRKFYRLHFDEQSVIEDMVGRLYELGHRRVGVADCVRYRSGPWSARRIEIIRGAVAKYQSMQLTVVRQDESFWTAGNENDGRMLRDWLAAATTDAPRRVESLEALVHEHKVTAIIALNDLLAVNYLYWCHARGVDVPRELSIVSFDNLYTFRQYPLSTIDFGFSTFGYLAAHILLDMVAVRADTQGGVAIPGRLLDRGSLGPPLD